MKVEDKVAIVTGGAQGIGRGISLVLARNGADVVVADINLEGAKSVAEEVVAAGRRSLAAHLDVADETSVDRMVEDVLAHFGRIDILVNNAAIIGAPGWERREYENEEDWDLIYAINVKGVIRVTEAVARHMKENRYGKIVNISSISGREGNIRNLPYGASKAGVINITQGKALELAPHNINVNAICPGFLWTAMAEMVGYRRDLSNEYPKGLSHREMFERFVDERAALKREQTPEDIGNLAAFLASDYAKNITGQAINVDGGYLMN